MFFSPGLNVFYYIKFGKLYLAIKGGSKRENCNINLGGWIRKSIQPCFHKSKNLYFLCNIMHPLAPIREKKCKDIIDMIQPHQPHNMQSGASR